MDALTQLTQSINWNVLYRAAHSTPVSEYGQPIKPIDPIEFELPSHAFVIGCENGGAPARWRLGAWLQVLAPSINTGSTTTITQDVEIARRTLTLRSRHFVAIPQYGIGPYKIRIQFPKWHAAMLVEAWWFDNDAYDVAQELLKSIDSKI